MLASVTGYQMLVMFSLGWLIRIELTGDTRYLGYMGIAIAVPAVVLNLFGGVFADKLNPKRLLWLTQFGSAMIVGGLGLLVALDMVQIWHVLVAGFLLGSVQAFDNPTRQSIFPRLVDREALPNAVAPYKLPMDRHPDFCTSGRGRDYRASGNLGGHIRQRPGLPCPGGGIPGADVYHA